MNNNYINFYNNLVNLARNQKLYKSFVNQDTFSDRLIILLFHFAFFLKIFKKDVPKKSLQEVFDFFFKQLELSIREIGYGDATINKKMKDYINTFYSIINDIENWENLTIQKKNDIFTKYFVLKNNFSIFADYYDDYLIFLKNNTFNLILKGVIKIKF